MALVFVLNGRIRITKSANRVREEGQGMDDLDVFLTQIEDVISNQLVHLHDQHLFEIVN